MQPNYAVFSPTQQGWQATEGEDDRSHHQVGSLRRTVSHLKKAGTKILSIAVTVSLLSMYYWSSISSSANHACSVSKKVLPMETEKGKKSSDNGERELPTDGVQIYASSSMPPTLPLREFESPISPASTKELKFNNGDFWVRGRVTAGSRPELCISGSFFITMTGWVGGRRLGFRTEKGDEASDHGERQSPTDGAQICPSSSATTAPLLRQTESPISQH